MPEPVFQENVTCHAWNNEHNELAICPGNNEIWIYNAKNESCKKWDKIHTLNEHSMRVTGLDWNKQSPNKILSSGQDRNAYVWEYNNQEKLWKPILVALRIGRAATCCKWSPSGLKFAVGSGSKQIPICYYEKSQDMWVAKMIKKAGKSTILAVDWAPNNLFLITSGSDFKCRIFSAYVEGIDNDCKLEGEYGNVFDNKIFKKKETQLGQALMEFDNAKGWVESCIFSPDGSQFSFCGHDSSISFGKIVSNTKTTIESVITLHRTSLPFTSVAFLNEKLVVAAGYDGIPVVFKYENENWVEIGNLDTGKKGSSNNSSKKKSAFGNAFAKFDQKSKLGKKESSDANLPFRHQNVINGIVVHKGTQFTTSSDDGRVLYWDTTKKY